MTNQREFNLEKFRAWLASSDPYQRDIALHVFWHLGIRDAAINELLAKMLQTEPEEKIRRAAVKFVAELADPSFTETLIGRLDDEDWCVKGHAFLGLMRIDPKLVQSNEQVKCFAEKETHPWSRFCIQERIKLAQS